MHRFLTSLMLAATYSFIASFSPAAAQAVKEYRTSDALVRVSRVQDAAPADSLGKATGAGADSLDLSSLFSGDRADDGLLQVYLLDIASGEELNFPVPVSRMRGFLAQHRGSYAAGSMDERAVSLVRDFSREARVRMKAPGMAESK